MTSHARCQLLPQQEKGVDTVACVAVNDAFVLDAWGKSVGADGKVLLLADGSALFTKVRRLATGKHTHDTCMLLSAGAYVRASLHLDRSAHCHAGHRGGSRSGREGPGHPLPPLCHAGGQRHGELLCTVWVIKFAILCSSACQPEE